MALKGIMLNKKLEGLRSKREELVKSREQLEAAETELEIAIGEAKTEEEIEAVNQKIEAHESDVKNSDEDISAVDSEIESVEKEIEEISEKSKPQGESAKTRSDVKTKQNNYDYGVRNNMLIETGTYLDRRERMRAALQNPEVKEFFETLIDFKKRGISGSEVLIPETVIDMINVDMTFVGSIYNLVTVRRLNGTARIILSGDTPDALWLECCGPLSEVNLEFSHTFIDCYKVGAFISVCNAILEDSFVNLADHIQQQFVKSITKAYDKAILTGDPLEKMPTGIIPSLAAANKVASSAAFAKVYGNFGKLPDDASNLTAVMNRNTYYTMFAGQTILPTAAGQVVMPQFTRLPDGTPVVFTPKDTMPDNQMLIGDFSKYLFVERAGIAVARSSEVRFIEDETLFKATSRCDGKPIDNNYWLLFTLTAPTT